MTLRRIVRRPPATIGEWPDDVPPLLRRLHAMRGAADHAQAHPRLAQLLAPELLGGIDAATSLLDAAIRSDRHIVVVGDSQARRFVSDGRFPWHPQRRATLAEVRQIGDVVLLRYALSPRVSADTTGET